MDNPRHVKPPRHSTQDVIPELFPIGKRFKRHSMCVIPTIIVTSLPPTYTQQELTNLCSSFGSVLFCEIDHTSANGSSATIRYSSIDEAKRALLCLHHSCVEGYDIKATISDIIEKEIRATQILRVSRISNSIEIQDLQPLFQRFGDISISNIRKGSHDWKCQIVYSSIEDAASAYNSMNRAILKPETLPINISFEDESTSTKLSKECKGRIRTSFSSTPNILLNM